MDTTKLKALAQRGYTLIPLNGKIPATRDWTKASAQDFPADMLERRGANYGVALGANDLVIDVDPRNFEKGDKPLARLVKAIGGAMPKTLTVRTGGGGLHVYLKKPADILVAHTLKDYPGLEFKTKGRQVVGPGSIHPETKKTYDVLVDAPAAAAPAALLELIKTTAAPYAEIEKGDLKNAQFDDNGGSQGRFVAYLKDVAPLSVEGKQGDATAFAVACCGRDLGLSPAITLELLAAHWNPRCSPPWEDAELEAKVVNAYKYAKKGAGNANPALDFTALPKEAPKKKEEPIVWQLTKNGQVVKCFYNLLNYLRLPQGGLHKVFGYNEFTGQVEFTNPAPWHRGQIPAFPIVQDKDLKLLKGFLAVKYGFEQNIGAIEEAISVTAEDNCFHPVRDYLDSLKGKWDGKPRISQWLQTYAGAADSAYTRAVGRKILCAAVKRIYHPGCVFHHVMVVEGAQGIGKSQLVKALAGKWAADFTVDPHNKDTVDAMQGKWIIELAEMSVLRRTEMSALKAFISRDGDRIRQAYGRLTREFRRQCIFIGSINPEADGAYLTDSTGNRRFWPVEAGDKIDWRGVARDRDQLFAEAIDAVQKGENIYMDNVNLEEEARTVVGTRHAEDPWTERIEAWLHDPIPGQGSGVGRGFVTAREVFIDALGGIDKALTRREIIRIANVMTSLGWRSVPKRFGERVVRGYSKEAAAKAKVKAPAPTPSTPDELDGL